MIKIYNINFGLNKFFQKIRLKKQYIKILKNKFDSFSIIKKQEYQHFIKKNNWIIYTIDISFSRVNTLLNVTDFSGKLKFFCSAGNLSYKGNSKKARTLVVKSMINFLIKKFVVLKSKPIALNLKNVKFLKFWIVKLFKKKFFIQIVKNFNTYSYNGCRKKKVRRKKFKKK